MRSIVTKLWLTIVIFVVSVLLITGFLLSGILTKFYFDQQAKSLVNKGRVVSGYLLTDEEARAIDKAQILADEARATIVIADPAGLVVGCSPGMQGRFMHGLRLNESEMKALEKGEEIIRIGANPHFETKMLWVAVPVREKNQLIRTVVLYAPVEPIAANIKQLQNLMLIIALGGIVVATVLALLLSKTLSRPLLEMNAAANKMIHGDFATKVKITSEDELGRLGNTLNLLSDELAKTLSALSYEKDQLRNVLTSMTDFVANVSHELRTPLCLIQGYGEALLDGLDENLQQRDEMVGIVVDETKRMQRLVNELLDLAQVEAGRISLVKEPVQVADLFHKIVKKFEGVAKEKGVAIQYSSAADLPSFRADFDRLEQILTNLVDNAFRHTPAGGIVALSGQLSSDAIILQISDTGQGISAEDLEHIWDRFYKADKARTRHQGGTGLGLSIVKALVEAHGGTIEAQSTVGAGTTFTLYFPHDSL